MTDTTFKETIFTSDSAGQNYFFLLFKILGNKIGLVAGCWLWALFLKDLQQQKSTEGNAHLWRTAIDCSKLGRWSVASFFFTYPYNTAFYCVCWKPQINLTWAKTRVRENSSVEGWGGKNNIPVRGPGALEANANFFLWFWEVVKLFQYMVLPYINLQK